MNRERLEALAVKIESMEFVPVLHLRSTENLEPTQFNMSLWHCGTCACIGGTAEAMFCNTFGKQSDTTIREVLGLDQTQALCLFYAPAGMKADNVQAARVIRNLSETGRVDWSI